MLDIELSPWRENSLNNELEAVPQFTEYLGIQIPHIEVQLQPGRDVASLIEAAANNWYLKQLGYSAAEDFMKRIETKCSRKAALGKQRNTFCPVFCRE